MSHFKADLHVVVRIPVAISISRDQTSTFIRAEVRLPPDHWADQDQIQAALIAAFGRLPAEPESR